jgi:nucleoside-diphosphate-sugar epimerase
MKALVTGANGFLGSYIVQLLLKKGHEVTAMTRRKDELQRQSDLRVANGDMRNVDGLLEAFQGQEVVFHTASVSGIWGSWKHFHSNNTIGTRNVVAACQQTGVKKLIYTSSPSVTFSGEDQINVNESVGYSKKWLCHYPHSKALAEQSVLQATEDSPLLTCALRPHLIWGPGDRHLIPRLLDRARQKKLIRVGPGTNQIDMIYVENAAMAHLQACEALKEESPVRGSAYFISQDEPVNCWGWINEILQLAGLPRVKRSISFKTAYRLGAALETYHEMFNIQREPRMTRFLALQLAKNHYFDISKAKRDFGYRPIVTSAEGMRRLEESLRG